MKKATPWGEWFDGRTGLRPLPTEAITDCSSSGSVDGTVSYWVKELKLEAPPWLLREYLRGYGAWDEAELCNHQNNLGRLLWVWASNCRDDPSGYKYTYLDR